MEEHFEKWVTGALKMIYSLITEGSKQGKDSSGVFNEGKFSGKVWQF